MNDSTTTLAERNERMAARLDEALDRLEAAPALTKQLHHPDVQQAAAVLVESDEGLRMLYERAPRFEPAGVFEGGPWADPRKLLPPLVRGSLEGPGLYPVLEAMSELRMLAIAKGRSKNERMDAAGARAFLEEIMALNLDLVFPAVTEEARVQGATREQAERLFGLLADELTLKNLRRVVVRELDQVCAQRPIMNQRALDMIQIAARIPTDPQRAEAGRSSTGGVRRGGALAAGVARLDEEAEGLLQRYLSAATGPSRLSREHPKPAEYRAVIRKLGRDELAEEAHAFAKALREAGIASPQHAILLRRLRSGAPDLLPDALGLNALGRAEMEQNETFAHQLLKVAILPATCQAIYGFAKVLERGLLSRSEVAIGLRRLVDLDLCPTARRNLLRKVPANQGVTANQVLLAGALSVLGQPLGIGQGMNPTCQAARGISLWSQHAPGFLLGLVASAARDDLVQIRFEDDTLCSNLLSGGVARSIDLELDPVSVIVVPHLDRIYDEMMRRCALRTEDGHKWANPALYGRWVPHGFACVIDMLTGAVVDHGGFVRRFYATHHPAFNDGYELTYPNPVGIFITTTHGDLLGLHAVSLQRVASDDGGDLRVYFFNPNNEGRQDWGQGIKPSISGRGEREGECSLPFDQFAARLYAFHYNPFEEGDAFAVPEETVDGVSRLAKESWGRAYGWV